MYQSKLDSINLSNEGLEKPDILGDAYMYLIKMFADDGGKKGGEFYTPEEVKEVMVRILKPKETDSIYDPTVGERAIIMTRALSVDKSMGLKFYPKNTLRINRNVVK